MSKILYFDVETTGLDLSKHHITQLSGLIEIDGQVMEEFNFFSRPPLGSEVSQKALDVTGKTADDLRSYPDSWDTYFKFVHMLDKYVDPYMKNKPRGYQFTPVAYNGYFDLQFLNKFFLDHDNKYFSAYQNWQLLDPLMLFRWRSFLGFNDLPDHKLSTICNYLDIEINAHDALSDIKATRELFLYLSDQMNNELIK